MQNKPYAKPLIAFIAALFVAVGFTGGFPSDLSYVSDTCKDDIDNDVDGVYGGNLDLIRSDSGDGECVWMPFNFGPGEYDGLAGTDPTSSTTEVQSYAAILLTIPDEYPTQYAALKAMGVNTCSDTSVQDSFTAYRDNFGVSSSTLGINEHQNECGLSY